jgi:hypothetical protein
VFVGRDECPPRDNFPAFGAASPGPKRVAARASAHDTGAPVIRYDRAVPLAERLDPE